VGGGGQRTASPVVVICITRGIGGLNGDSPTESVGASVRVILAI